MTKQSDYIKAFVDGGNEEFKRHEGLLDALKICARDLHKLHEYHYPQCTGGCFVDASIKAANAAIAKAEETDPE